ncbi:hypothetical protein ACFJIX_18960 [Roseateles sp. UC29_93]|uniref:hypothetical protein n=1 Tax=Roseateles sp. UC29_93 TaxID=3350177 RepID=UPI00366CFBD0
MDAENFWADVEVEKTEQGTFVAVLVMGIAEDPDQVTRVPLAGEHALPDLARSAALDAIAAMSLEGNADCNDAAAPPADA